MSNLGTYSARNMTIEAEDSGTFQQQALEIRLPDADFDPNSAPTTGEEYLTHMAYERKRMPAIVSRRPQSDQLASEVSNVEQVCSASILSDETSAEQIREFVQNSMIMLPNNVWKIMQLQKFEASRKKINKIRATFKPYANLEMPQSNDSDVWLEFCRQHPPMLRYILNIAQRDLELLLDIMCEWLQWGEKSSQDAEQNSDAASEQVINCDVSELNLTKQWFGQWLYGILVCLHLPLEPEVHSTLREIARISIRQRGRLPMPEGAKYAIVYNIFIHLIANVFGQLDFAEFI